MIVCFDLGGVLVRICRSWQEGCEAAQVPLRPFNETDEIRTQRSTLIANHQMGKLPAQEYFKALSTLHESIWSPEEIQRIHNAWVLGPYPETSELINEIRLAGHQTACLSNTNESHWLSLLEDTAISQLDHTHASHLMGLHKPDPHIWPAFEQLTECNAHDVVFFDDLLENVQSAISAGWDAIQIDHESPTVPQIRKALQERSLL